MKKLIAAGVLILLCLSGLAAEVQSTVTLTALSSLGRYGDEAALTSLITGRLELKSLGNKNVRGLLQLDATLASGLLLEVPRAYIKVRFPWFRTTLGRSRVSWGDGFVFNAGDVVFGSMDLIQGDISADALRDETAWLWEVYIPLGAFSYVETVLLPYAGAEDPSMPVDLGQTAAGLRVVTKLWGITVEGGYLYHGADGEHRPYANFHGPLFEELNWTLSGSLSIPWNVSGWQAFADNIGLWSSLSAGLFYKLNRPSLTFRLEAGIKPGGEWAESTTGAAGSDPGYALFLYPEIAYALSDTLGIQLRSLISPLDGSALVFASLSWNIYQGLNVLNHLSVMLGDKNDIYGWDRDFGIAWSLGMEYIY